MFQKTGFHGLIYALDLAEKKKTKLYQNEIDHGIIAFFIKKETENKGYSVVLQTFDLEVFLFNTVNLSLLTPGNR